MGYLDNIFTPPTMKFEINPALASKFNSTPLMPDTTSSAEQASNSFWETIGKMDAELGNINENNLNNANYLSGAKTYFTLQQEDLGKQITNADSRLNTKYGNISLEGLGTGISDKLGVYGDTEDGGYTRRHFAKTLQKNVRGLSYDLLTDLLKLDLTVLGINDLNELSAFQGMGGRQRRRLAKTAQSLAETAEQYNTLGENIATVDSYLLNLQKPIEEVSPELSTPTVELPEMSLEDKMKVALQVTGNANRARALGMSLNDYLNSDVRSAINKKYTNINPKPNTVKTNSGISAKVKDYGFDPHIADLLMKSGYTPEKLDDGSYSFVGNNGRTVYYNNNRVAANGGMHNWKYVKGAGIKINKNGGTMNKINYFLAGGPAPAAAPAQGGEDMQAQIVQLVQAAMSGDEQATQTINQIMQAAQQGDQQATQIAQMIQQVAQQMQGQAQAAKRGAKLAYIHSLRTGCPEGTEAVYTMKNGGVCKACVKKAEMAKAGSKAKKMQKGDEIPEEKCGGKAKKHFFGGLLNLIG